MYTGLHRATGATPWIKKYLSHRTHPRARMGFLILGRLDASQQSGDTASWESSTQPGGPRPLLVVWGPIIPMERRGAPRRWGGGDRGATWPRQAVLLPGCQSHAWQFPAVGPAPGPDLKAPRRRSWPPTIGVAGSTSRHQLPQWRNPAGLAH